MKSFYKRMHVNIFSDVSKKIIEPSLTTLYVDLTMLSLQQVTVTICYALVLLI